MAAATDEQVQQFVNERVRRHSELARSLVLACDDDRASIDSVYEALTQQNPTWTDNRTDGPPNLLLGSDVLAFNSFIENVRTYIKGLPEYAVILKACVRPII